MGRKVEGHGEEESGNGSREMIGDERYVYHS